MMIMRDELKVIFVAHALLCAPKNGHVRDEAAFSLDIGLRFHCDDGGAMTT